MTTNIKDEPRLLRELVESLQQASGGAGQLIHALTDPRWIVIRETIDKMKEGVISLASIHASKVTTVKQ